MYISNMSDVRWPMAAPETLALAGERLSVSDVAVALAVLFAANVVVQKLTTRGPMMWPVFGIFPALLLNFGDVYEWITDSLRDSDLTFHYRGVWFGGAHGAVTADPTNVEYMLKTRFANFPKGKYYRERFGDLLGGGIFNADDESWREQRRAATAEMHSTRFTRYSFTLVTDLVHRRLLPLASSLSSSGRATDLQDVLLRFTFDNICAAALGADAGCLAASSAGDLPDVAFARDFEQATELSLRRFVMPPFVWKPMRALNVGSERRLKTAVKGVHEFAERVVADRSLELRQLGSLDQRFDLLSRLVEAKEEETTNPKFSTTFMKDFCISFILAGRDTSSVALTWFFWLLHKHPRVEDRILDEIRAILSLRGAITSLDHVTFTAEELKGMEYLQAALSEALRLYPSVPLDFKEVLEDDVLPDGTRVKKGGRVLYSIYSMARAENLWGKDCREFRPERWMDKEGRFVSENQFKYAVFNAGPRLCVGKRFAYVQMKMVAASLLVRFRVLPVEGQHIAPKMTTTLYMKNGLMVRFSRRDINI